MTLMLTHSLTVTLKMITRIKKKKVSKLKTVKWYHVQTEDYRGADKSLARP